MKAFVATAFSTLILAASLLAESEPPAPQYSHGDITIPFADDNETTRKEFSAKAAVDYLERSSLAWARERGCVSCHTPGTYLQVMPELTPVLGKPSEDIHRFFLSELQKMMTTEHNRFDKGTKTAQVIYIAAGLAEWDRHVNGGTLSDETDEALRLMFELQRDSGTWQSLDCWPPFESSAYQEATVAAMAAATAPGWLDERAAIDAALGDRVESLKNYLKSTPPPHDYGRVLLLWTSARVEALIDAAQKKEIVDMIWKNQHDDGGWSIRDFAEPEQWGKGNRAEKLKAEPDFANPPSDGHMTGLAVLVLRESGTAAEDERIQQAVKWLKANQRESGRWWTRSLNTDKFHFITYSGTAYPLLALARCEALSGSEQ